MLLLFRLRLFLGTLPWEINKTYEWHVSNSSNLMRTANTPAYRTNKEGRELNLSRQFFPFFHHTPRSIATLAIYSHTLPLLNHQLHLCRQLFPMNKIWVFAEFQQKPQYDQTVSTKSDWATSTLAIEDYNTVIMQDVYGFPWNSLFAGRYKSIKIDHQKANR